MAKMVLCYYMIIMIMIILKILLDWTEEVQFSLQTCMEMMKHTEISEDM